ncbi:MAG TPA: adenosylcobalamin-dependent ribonucleoside-diphosphate reductase [Bacillota bacterium]
MADFGGLPTELAWKIFIDRYTLKDQNRNFQAGELAVVQTNDDPRWPKKELGRVVKVAGDGDGLEIELLTGADRGRRVTRRRHECDRPLETHLRQVAERIARGLAAVEPDDKARRHWEQVFADEIAALRVVPGGRVWAGAGTGIPLTLFNCYVLPNPKDSRQGIVETLGQMIEVMSRGGGVGINVSSLRPYRAVVKGVNGRSSGAVSWMELYSLATGLVEQGGSRRGALMLQLDIRHPDWKRFVDCKKVAGKVENANISLRITDEFMAAVKAGRDWTFWFPDTTHPKYEEIWDGDFDAWERLGLPRIEYETLPARRVWDEIIKGAWESAEPGIVFSSRHEEDSNSWYFNRLICTNPCGEQPLPGWGVCTLGHINLSRMYDARKHDVDWDQLRFSIRTLVRLLDDVVDATHYFIEANRENQMRERRIGAGTLGLGELLIRLGLRYGSPEAVAFTDKLYRFIAVEAYRASVDLAREKGPFPAFDADKFLQSGFMRRMPEEIRALVREHGVRNVTILTQAPTGTVGTMLDTSTGIEPFYSLKFFRQSRLGRDLQYVRVAEEWLEAHPGQELPDYFVGALDLTPEEHIAMQAAVQRWNDSSISKTANAPADYTVEQTAELYMKAYDLGCKGVTIYRDRSRHEQVLHDASKTGEGKKAGETAGPAAVPAVDAATGFAVNGTWGSIKPVPRPAQLHGITMRKPTPLGNLFITLNTYEGRPFELFAQIGKAGSDVTAFTEAIARLVSLAFRSGVDPWEVVEQLAAIGGSHSVGFGARRIRSVPDAIAQALAAYLEGQAQEDPEALRARGQTSVFDTPKAGDAGSPEGKQGGGDPVPAGAPAGAGNATAGAVPSTRGLGIPAGGANGNGVRLSFDLCPECGSMAYVYEEGCAKCMACGHSRC